MRREEIITEMNHEGGEKKRGDRTREEHEQEKEGQTDLEKTNHCMHSQIKELREMGGEDMMLTVQAGKVVKHFAYHPKECGLFNDVVSEVFKEGVE